MKRTKEEKPLRRAWGSAVYYRNDWRNEVSACMASFGFQSWLTYCSTSVKWHALYPVHTKDCDWWISRWLNPWVTVTDDP